jgi:two-component system sensor histidine kinase ArlS
MRKNRFTKISWKLTLTYSGIFSLVLILLNTATIIGVKYFLWHQAVNQVKETGELIIGRIEELDGFLRELKDKDLVLEIPANDNIYVKIIDQNGKIINESEKYNQKIPRQIPVKINKLKSWRGLVYETRKINLRHHKYAYLQIVKSLGNENNFIRVLIMIVIVADLLGMGFSFLAGLVVSKKMLTPITKITNTARNISINDLNRRIATDGPNDELTTLATTFNAMIDRLQDSFRVQNQFVSDASHELRTPIAVIQGYANLLDRWGKTDPKILQEALDAIKNETTHMTGMVERMLFLARGDSGSGCLQKENLNFTEVVDEVFKETRLITADFIMENQCREPVMIYGDRNLLKQMLRALIDNSIKYSPQAKQIIINLSVSHDCVMATFQDLGMGIPAGELSKIFNRFYQVDQARGRGCGLGLAIVKWIVEAHSGEIAVVSELGQGTIFTIRFPLCEAGEPNSLR